MVLLAVVAVVLVKPVEPTEMVKAAMVLPSVLPARRLLMPVAVLVRSMLVRVVQPETAVVVKVDSIAAQTVYPEPRTPAAVVAVVKTQVLAVRLDQESSFYGIRIALALQ
jgi:hypothetical protein